MDILGELPLGQVYHPRRVLLRKAGASMVNVLFLGCLALADVLQDSFCMEECCEKKADLLRVRQLLETLPARERQILLLRYGLAGQPPLTQLETAQLLGISRSYVSRIEKKALHKLEEALRDRR